MIKPTLAIFLILFGVAAALPADTPDSYRTGTPDPLIRRMPDSIRSLKAKGAEAYLGKVAEYIAENALDEYDKVKKTHDWVALNIRYDVRSFFSGRIPYQTVSGVVSSGLAVCQGYAEVFYYLCRLLDIECEIVTGYARGYGRSLTRIEDPYSTNHAWNKVKINGKWYLIDATWNSGQVSGQNFVPKYRTVYLFPDPRHFLHNHFPENPADQLIPKPLTAEEFVRLPLVDPEFFSIITEMNPELEKITQVNGKFFRIDFVSPPERYFLYELSIGGTKYNNVFSSRKRDGKTSLTFAFQKPGNYRLQLYSSTKPTGRHEGIGEFGFNVSIQDSASEGIPGGARLLLPEGLVLPRNALADSTEFRVAPGKWKFIALIQGSYFWQYLSPDEEGVYCLSSRLSSGTYWLAASETEAGVYETLAVFTVR